MVIKASKLKIFVALVNIGPLASTTTMGHMKHEGHAAASHLIAAITTWNAYVSHTSWLQEGAVLLETALKRTSGSLQAVPNLAKAK